MNTPYRRVAQTLLSTCLTVGIVTTALAQTKEPPRGIAAAGSDDVARQFEAAMEAYERNHWADAYTQLSGLADRGHAEAARIAGQMQRHGPVLYGVHFLLTPGQAQRWAEVRSRR